MTDIKSAVPFRQPSATLTQPAVTSWSKEGASPFARPNAGSWSLPLPSQNSWDMQAWMSAVKAQVNAIAQHIQVWFESKTATLPILSTHHALVEQMAESPFEKQLLLMPSEAGQYRVSKAWAQGIRNADPVVREAAITLLKAYLSYQGLPVEYPLSTHSQMKFTQLGHLLQEGLMGRAYMYEALAAAPLEIIMELADVLKQDVSRLPAVAQGVVLKQYLRRLRTMDGMTRKNAEAAAFKKLVKSLVMAFYNELDEDNLDEGLEEFEHLPVGMNKLSPIRKAYKQSIETTEKRFRVVMRQVKKRRQLKMAEIEEENRRRWELIYDELEQGLVADLDKAMLSLAQVVEPQNVI